MVLHALLRCFPTFCLILLSLLDPPTSASYVHYTPPRVLAVLPVGFAHLSYFTLSLPLISRLIYVLRRHIINKPSDRRESGEVLRSSRDVNTEQRTSR